MALVQLVWYGGQLYADDVLYHRGRLDDPLFCQDGPGGLCGAGYGRCGGAVWDFDGSAGRNAGLYGDRGAAGHGCVCPWAAERCGKDHESYDGLPAGHSGRAGGPRRDAARRGGRIGVLPQTRLPAPDVRLRRQPPTGRGHLCRHGAGLFYPFPGDRGDGHFWKLYW